MRYSCAGMHNYAWSNVIIFTYVFFPADMLSHYGTCSCCGRPFLKFFSYRVAFHLVGVFYRLPLYEYCCSPHYPASCRREYWQKNIKLFLILFLMLRGCPLIKLIIINNRKHINNNNNINNNIYLLLVVCPYVK